MCGRPACRAFSHLQETTASARTGRQEPAGLVPRASPLHAQAEGRQCRTARDEAAGGCARPHPPAAGAGARGAGPPRDGRSGGEEAARAGAAGALRPPGIAGHGAGGSWRRGLRRTGSWLPGSPVFPPQGRGATLIAAPARAASVNQFTKRTLAKAVQVLAGCDRPPVAGAALPSGRHRHRRDRGAIVAEEGNGNTSARPRAAALDRHRQPGAERPAGRQRRDARPGQGGRGARGLRAEPVRAQPAQRTHRHRRGGDPDPNLRLDHRFGPLRHPRGRAAHPAGSMRWS